MGVCVGCPCRHGVGVSVVDSLKFFAAFGPRRLALDGGRVTSARSSAAVAFSLDFLATVLSLFSLCIRRARSLAVRVGKGGREQRRWLNLRNGTL